MKFKITLFLLIIVVFQGYSQDMEPEEHNTEEKGNHSIAFFVSHTYISQGKIDGKREWLNAPSFALNYNFKLNEKWSIGLHNDIILESFVIEDSESFEGELEREVPISNLIMGSYKITEAWGFAFGGGIEWEKNENIPVVRLGTEYGLELKNENLELLFSLNYDLLIDAYDSINLGIGINKFFN